MMCQRETLQPIRPPRRAPGGRRPGGVAAVCVALCLALCGGPAPARQPPPKGAKQVYRETLRGTAWVRCPVRTPTGADFATGTGWLVEQGGGLLVVTSHHVV